jgi:cell division protein FtsN
MKKWMIVCAGLCMVMSLTSCKSKESAYRKAYEKAKAQEAENAAIQNNSENVAVVAPVQTVPATPSVPSNVANANVRQESVSVISGSGLKNYSVVVGSFSLKANAEGLQQTLKNAGYDAQIVYNAGINMYRVVATTFVSKEDAVRSRDQLNGTYQGAWLLYAK